MNLLRPISVLEVLAKDLNYCCVWALMKAHKAVRSGRLATELGVSRSSVKQRRHDMRIGKCACEKYDDCLKKKLFGGRA